MSRNYQLPELYSTRNDPAAGNKEWCWIDADNGAWEGPLNDWNKSHKGWIEKLLPDHRHVVIQAGGCQGMYPWFLSQMFEYVYTFEPCFENFYSLAVNNPQENVVKFNAALGAKPGFITVKRPQHRDNTGTYTVRSETYSVIPQMTIDQFQFPAVSLIMLDVEGYENNVIEGALDTIQKYKPIIFAENGGSIQDRMGDLGYVVAGSSVSDMVFKPI